jgi:hypothetical protein
MDPFTLFGVAAILEAAARLIAELRRWFRPRPAPFCGGDLPRVAKRETSKRAIVKNSRLPKMRDKVGPAASMRAISNRSAKRSATKRAV